MIVSCTCTYLSSVAVHISYGLPVKKKKKKLLANNVLHCGLLVGYTNGMIFLALLFGSCLLLLTADDNDSNSNDANTTNAGFVAAVLGSCCYRAVGLWYRACHLVSRCPRGRSPP